MSRARRKRLSICALMAAFLIVSILDHAGTFGYRGDDRVRYDGVRCKSVRVIDGNSLEVDIPDGRNPTTLMCLRGVDARELGHDSTRRAAHSGSDSRTFLADQVDRRTLTIRLDPNRPTRDKQGRLLAYLHVEDEIASINEGMIESGYARADRHSAHVLQLRFSQREKSAERDKKGLWSRAIAD